MDAALDRTGALFIREAMPEPDTNVAERPVDPARWGDVVLVRKDTPTSYHLSVTVDDAIQGVTHVTRGMDLYAASDIHSVLQALLGLDRPIYTHHDLIVGGDREKLSKSRGSESLADLRAQGTDAKKVRDVLGFAQMRQNEG